MSYITGGSIQSADYNGFANANTPNVNSVWSTGSGNRGYGQASLSTVAVGQKVAATNWINLITTINSAASHQGTAIGTLSPSPATGVKVKAFTPTLASNISAIDSGRLNAVAQGTDSTTTVTNSTSSWSDSLTVTFTVTFPSSNATRYFFNAGGQLGLQFSHPSGAGINTLISDICSEAGTIWLSSPTSGTATLSGTAFNGVTKIGGVVSSRGTASTNNGYYAWTPVSSLCYQQYGDVPYGYYTSGTYLRISAAALGAGVLTITCVIDEVPNGAIVFTGTQSTLRIRPPSTTYLTNTWGTPGVASSMIIV